MNSDPALNHLAAEVLDHTQRLAKHDERITTLEKGHTAATEAAEAAAEAAERVAQHQEGFETSIHSAMAQQRIKFAQLAAAELDRAFDNYQESKEARRKQLEDDEAKAERRRKDDEAKAERRRKWILAIVVATLGVLSPALAALSNRLSAPAPAASAAPAPTIDLGELARKIDELDRQRHDDERKK